MKWYSEILDRIFCPVRGKIN